MSGSSSSDPVTVLRRLWRSCWNMAGTLGGKIRRMAGGEPGGPGAAGSLDRAGKGAMFLGLVFAGTALWQVGQGGGGGLPEGGILVLMGLVWAIAVASASCLPLWAFAGAGLWLAWDGLALMAPWAGTPLVTLPVWWLLVVAHARWAWRGPGRKFPGLVLWGGISLGAGWIMSEASGWNRLLGLTVGTAWTGKVLLGGGIAGLGIALRPVWRDRSWPEPSFGWIAAGSLVVMAAGLTASAARDFPAAEGWAWGVVEASGPWAALGWFWLGGGFAVTLMNVAEGMTRPVVRGLTLEAACWIFLAGWLGVTLMEWLATRGTSPALTASLLQALAPLAEEPAAKLDPLRRAMEAHVWVGVVVLVLGTGFIWQGRETVRLLPRLNALWLAAFPGLLVVAEALPSQPALSSTGNPVHWSRVLLLGLGGGWIWLRLRQDQTWESRPHWPARWGAMAVGWGILLAVEFRAAGPWATGAGTAALLGMLHLAMPLVLHRWWTGGQKTENVLTLGTVAWLIPAGWLSVLPLLYRNPVDASQLAYCPMLWLSVLLCLRWYQPRLEVASGALAGALMGSAAVAAWCRPGLLLPEVPLFQWLNPPVAALGLPAGPERPFMDLTHFILLVLMTAAGAILGALVFRNRPGPEVPLMPLLTNPEEALPQSRMG